MDEVRNFDEAISVDERLDSDEVISVGSTVAPPRRVSQRLVDVPLTLDDVESGGGREAEARARERMLDTPGDRELRERASAWMSAGWMPELSVIDWPLYAGLRELHTEAVGAVQVAHQAHADLSATFAAEDAQTGAAFDERVVQQRERIAEEIRAGKEPAAEDVEPARPATGAVRRQAELDVAAETVAAAEARVPRVAAVALQALAGSYFELAEAADFSFIARQEAAVRETEQAVEAERARRRAFYEGRPVQYEPREPSCCETCSAEASLQWIGEAIRAEKGHERVQREYRAVREWLLGPYVVEGRLEHPWRDEPVSPQTLVTEPTRPYLFERGLEAIGADVPDLADERPDGAPNTSDVIGRLDAVRELIEEESLA